MSPSEVQPLLLSLFASLGVAIGLAFLLLAANLSKRVKAIAAGLLYAAHWAVVVLLDPSYKSAPLLFGLQCGLLGAAVGLVAHLYAHKSKAVAA